MLSFRVLSRNKKQINQIQSDLFTPGTKIKTNRSIYDFNGFAFLDDHEYDALIPLRKTISGTRTEIDMGYNVDSANHFAVGTNALHEFGGGLFSCKRWDPVKLIIVTPANIGCSMRENFPPGSG